MYLNGLWMEKIMFMERFTTRYMRFHLTSKISEKLKAPITWKQVETRYCIFAIITKKLKIITLLIDTGIYSRIMNNNQGIFLFNINIICGRYCRKDNIKVKLIMCTSKKATRRKNSGTI